MAKDLTSIDVAELLLESAKNALLEDRNFKA